MHIFLRKAYAFSLELVFALAIVVTGGPIPPKVPAPAIEPGRVASSPNPQSVNQRNAAAKDKEFASRSAGAWTKAATRLSRKSRETQVIRSRACAQDSRESGFGGE